MLRFAGQQGVCVCPPGQRYQEEPCTNGNHAYMTWYAWLAVPV